MADTGTITWLLVNHRSVPFGTTANNAAEFNSSRRISEIRTDPTSSVSAPQSSREYQREA